MTFFLSDFFHSLGKKWLILYIVLYIFEFKEQFPCK